MTQHHRLPPLDDARRLHIETMCIWIDMQLTLKMPHAALHTLNKIHDSGVGHMFKTPNARWDDVALVIYGITGQPANTGPQAMLRNWQAAARDRLASA